MLKLASEKNLNKFIYPIFNVKGREIEYPVIHKDKFECYQGHIGARNLMLLDIFTTIIIQMYINRSATNFFFNKIHSERNKRAKEFSSYHVCQSNIRGFLAYMNENKLEIIPQEICRKSFEEDPDEFGKMRREIDYSLSDTFLRKNLPILSKFSSKQLHDLILETANVKVRMIYPMRYYDLKSKKYDNFIFTNHRESSFFRIDQVENIRTSKNGNVLARRYHIRYDTILGYIFVQNSLSAYVDLVPMKFYEMSEYSQLFYRIFILPYYNGVKNNLSIDKIRMRLGWKTRDVYALRKMIKRILDELESEKFIKEPKELPSYGSFKYSYPKCSWSEINS